MKGLPLCEAYFRAHGEPMLREKFPEACERIAAGLAGPGSECFGFDDELSRDHDWGPSFCLWLSDTDAELIGPRLAAEYARLPQDFMGFGPRIASPGEEHRVGPCRTWDFYQTYLGARSLPETPSQWLRIAEESLAACTNGMVWTDPLGEFTAIREALLAYYPEDVRLKKIASRCITIAQAGQYNFARSTKRGQPLRGAGLRGAVLLRRRLAGVSPQPALCAVFQVGVSRARRPHAPRRPDEITPGGASES